MERALQASALTHYRALIDGAGCLQAVRGSLAEALSRLEALQEVRPGPQKAWSSEPSAARAVGGGRWAVWPGAHAVEPGALAEALAGPLDAQWAMQCAAQRLDALL